MSLLTPANNLKPIPLPPNVPDRLLNNPNIVSAYGKCLTLEKSLMSPGKNKSDVDQDLVFIRILGYLIHYSPTDAGIGQVIREILSSSTDLALLDVGKIYFNHYIRSFKRANGPTPASTNHTSRSSFDTDVDMINDQLESAPRSHAKAKQDALIRDGLRCVITGKYDTSKTTLERLSDEDMQRAEEVGTTFTNCAHIFAESTGWDTEPRVDKAASLWTIMERFGYTTLQDELNGPNIHRLENVLTLDCSMHTRFNELRVCLIATEEPNRYKVHCTVPIDAFGQKKYVTFTTPDEDKYPLPSPVYLAIHAACCQVARMSGAAEYIEELYRDMDASQTLDPSGASANLLEHALFKLQPYRYETTV